MGPLEPEAGSVRQTPKTFSVLNLPNLFSIARILSVPLFIILLINQFLGWALVVFLAAAVSDAVDGLLARLLHQRTILGAYLDPAADKLLTASAFTTLAIQHILPGWLAVIVISRDVIICLGIALLFLTSRPAEIRPTVISKITTILQLLTVIAALSSNYGFAPAHWSDILVWGTTLATIISGLQYIGKGIKIINYPIL